MTNRIVTAISFLIVILTSCNNITPKDLTIIDGIRLGTTQDGLNSQCDSLKIQQPVFYTKTLFSITENTIDYRLKGYVTNIFNTSEYNGGSQTLQHFGLFYPMNVDGTKNIVGLTVLLFRTSQALIISNTGISSLTKETNIQSISQNMSSSQIESIASMLTEKYGKPTSIVKDPNTTFYVFENNKLNPHSSDSTNIGEMITWKTKYLYITFFKGLASGTDTYTMKNHSYMSYFDYNPKRIIKYEDGEGPCRSYSYITYKLNELAEKKLKLDKVKL
jgi:hypothetical protein